MPKASGKKQKLTWDESGNILTISYPSIGKRFIVDTRKYSAGIQEDARQHGFHQKFGDAESGGTPAEKYAEVQLIHASLMEGNWTRTAGPVDRTPEILEAVAGLKGLKIAEGPTLINPQGAKLKVTEEMVKEWGANEEVRVRIQENRLAKAKAHLAETKAELTVDFK